MDAQELLAQKQAEEMGKVVKPTILVCGYTGSGKTSLIQAVCGRGTVPDDRIGHGKPMTHEFVPYRNDFINLWDSKGLEPGDREAAFLANTKKHVSQLRADADARNHIHLVWYAIQGSGARVTATDVELIRSVFSNVIVVITKNDITRPHQREAITTELVGNGVPRADIVAVSESDTESLRALVALSLERLPDAYRDAFLSAQLIDLDRKKVRAQAIIHAAALSAAGAAVMNPLPIADAALITPIQLGMIASLAGVYGLSKEGMKAAAAPLVAQVAGILVASNLTKFIPWLGQFIQGSVAAALTEVIGQFVDSWMIRCCEALIRGLPMPEFQMPLAGIAQLVKAKVK